MSIAAGQRWTHVKRGTTYELIGIGELQMSADLVDGSSLVIYRGDDGKLWAREEGEFLDGRFEPSRMTPTNDAPVMVEREALSQAVAVLERLPYGDWPGPMYSGKTVAANALIRRLRAALASAPAEPRLNPTPIEALADTFTGKTEVDRLAIILMRAFGKAEPKEGISQHPASYVATFADMARAIIASAPAGDGEKDEILRIVRWIDQVIERAKKHGNTEGLWLFRGQWQTVRAALDRPRAAVGEQDAAREILRLAEVFRDGCGHTQNTSGRGELTEAGRLSGVPIYAGEPAGCDECSADFVQRVVAVLQRPTAKLEG